MVDCIQQIIIYPLPDLVQGGLNYQGANILSKVQQQKNILGLDTDWIILETFTFNMIFFRFNK